MDKKATQPFYTNYAKDDGEAKLTQQSKEVSIQKT